MPYKHADSRKIPAGRASESNLHPDVTEQSIKSFIDRNVSEDACLITDGMASYTPGAAGPRKHVAAIQPPQARALRDALQRCHWTISLIRRWWLGTHHGAISRKYLQSYLDEYAFRFNRRRTSGVGQVVARLLEGVVAHGPESHATIVAHRRSSPRFLPQST